MRIPVLLVLLASAGAPVAALSQDGQLDWRWHINATFGRASGTGTTWLAIYHAMDSGWGLPSCFFGAGCPRPQDYRTDAHWAWSGAARLALNESVQIRALAGFATHGYLRLENLGEHADAHASVLTAGVQGALIAGPFWLALGPTVNRASVTVITSGQTHATSRINLGLAFGAGITFPASEPFFLELAIERRLAGSVAVGATPAGTAPRVPVMTVPLSYSVASAGVGWRLAPRRGRSGTAPRAH